MHTVSVILHPEVTVKFSLNVARSVEEAALQASGKSIQELAAEAEAEADFEIANLFSKWRCPRRRRPDPRSSGFADIETARRQLRAVFHCKITASPGIGSD